jgi:O-antigen biosynthesis protein
MARPALKSEPSEVAEDLPSDDQAGDIPGDLLIDSSPEPGGVVRPFVRKGNRRIRESGPGEDRLGSFFTDDLVKNRADENIVLRPVFPKTSAASEIVQFFLEPPKSIPVVEDVRPSVEGKFLFVGDEKFYIRGVTYGPFRPDESGCEYHTPEQVERDFAQMAENGINSVRVYTVPPRWLLDVAQRHGLRVMIGLPWEQHITFLDNKKLARDIERRVRLGVRASAGHPALLCYTVGNEIPATIVRWFGRHRIEAFLERLYTVVKEEDPEALVTYVNFPTTEYLQLPFVDFVSFNVYLETQEKLDGYLARLQILAGDRPLVMAEIGLDSMRNGEAAQASTLEWQIRSTFAAGCAGVFIFAWTDEWHRGGFDIEDWGFGLTDRNRQSKQSLEMIRKAFAEVPFPPDLPWPSVSVVVCSYNGERTIRDCLQGLRKLDYPNYEVIVVNDGSKDRTEAIAKEFGFRLISTENRGLSSARNTGMRAAKGEIVAYIDDDAIPDPHWLTYLAASYLRTNHMGIGGPNLPPRGDSPTADCVANSPGNATHVLLTDDVAEHIPGCNMSFRKEALEAIGGFDERFRIAGDDVDLCWRIQEQGWTVGFNPVAMVWHHRRSTVKAYLKQQMNYGKAEAMLERKWPEKYNAAGHIAWAGRLYFKGFEQLLGFFRGRVYQGTWGAALFQSIYQPASGLLSALPMMPEWYVVVAALAGLSLLSFEWSPLMIAWPLLFAAMVVPFVHAVFCGMRSQFTTTPKSRHELIKMQAVTAYLHMAQPLVRLWGRIRLGLTPWRRCEVTGVSAPWPWPKTFNLWNETWRSSIDWLESLEANIKALRTVVMRGGDYDRWDLELRGGLLGSVRVLMAVEEHGGGKQLVRFRTWPKCSSAAILLTLLFAALSAAAAVGQAWIACGALNVVAFLFMMRIFKECGAAMNAVTTVLRPLEVKKA